MANRQKADAGRERSSSLVITPSQDDEADILEEVGATPDESGNLTASEDQVRKIGAVDAESVRENRRRDNIVDKKRGNVPHVSFNTGEALDTYDTILRVFPTNQVEIRAKNLRTGTTLTITSRPKTGNELYDALILAHGQQEAAEYEVVFVDSVRKGWLGKPRIGLPDTRPPSQQGQPPMNYPPQGYPPPGYPPQSAYAPQQPAPVQQQPAPAPVVQFTPPAVDPMALMQQTFDLFQRMQAALQPPPPQYPQYQQPPQQTVPAMPPPPQTNDPAVQAAWMRQAFDLFQQMQAALQRPAQQPPPQQPQQPPPAQSGPPGPPPRGYMWVWRHDYNSFVLMPESNSAPPDRGPTGPMYRGGGRPGYDPERFGPPQQPQQPQRAQTLTEQLRESMATMRTTVETMQEMSSLLPGFGGQQEAPDPVPEDDGPVRAIKMGPATGIINTNDGSTRWGETFVANIPDILNWIGKQHEQIVQRAERRQQQEQRPAQRRQLRPGEVEVTPGYQPPPGMVAVEVLEEDDGLPPPPANVPPPVSAPTPRRTWGPPTVTEEGES